ncbi:Hpt domain-containing protein [Vibrio aquaticus]|uniref:Phosphorelay protein LuxU n=1 Tax=Vibrio aquaticus TaxID=2496559 RepID=A0A432CTS4_9VIBR|nr:quorum-sensing phosphorelay protein LuxU [Vibrio aquaticus]RTZ14097.1 Hpt domain-containing protein [Vibrio aquaticus]
MEILNQNKINKLADEIGQDNVPVLLEIFLGELAMYLDNLANKPDSEQEEYLKEISHALKSSAASFGAEALCACSMEIDAEAKSGTALNLEVEKARMVSLLEQTQQRYQQLV